MSSAGIAVDLQLPLDRYTLQVQLQAQRHVTGIFGPSGCGKTSLLEALAGVRKGVTGSIRVGDTIWLDTTAGICLPTEKRNIGYVPQAGLLLPHLNVKQNLQFGQHRARRAGDAALAMFDHVVDLLELHPLLGRHVQEISGGERQRVALGRALCSAPDLLVLDEPLSALDHKLRYRIIPFLRRIRDEFAMPMLLVSHDPVEVQALCDDLFVLRDGQVIANGEPRALLTDPSIAAHSLDDGFNNVLPCVTRSSSELETLVQLGDDGQGPELVVTNLDGHPREGSLVGVGARSIMLATGEAGSYSARNRLQATIKDVQTLHGRELVRVQPAGTDLTMAVELGSDGCQALGVAAGDAVQLVIKATACRLYGQQLD